MGKPARFQYQHDEKRRIKSPKTQRATITDRETAYSVISKDKVQIYPIQEFQSQRNPTSVSPGLRKNSSERYRQSNKHSEIAISEPRTAQVVSELRNIQAFSTLNLEIRSSGGPSNMEKRVQIRKQMKSTLENPMLSSRMLSSRSQSNLKHSKQFVPLEAPQRNQLNWQMQQNAILKELQMAVYGHQECEEVPLEYVASDYEVSRDGFQQILFKLGYLPYLQEKDVYNRTSKVFQVESELQPEVTKAENLFKNMWQ